MKTPWHIWIVGIVSLLWNAMGAIDYLMTQIRYEPYMAQFTDAQRAYFESFPTWVVASWAAAVWLSVAGSLLILLRSRHAASVLGLVLVFMFVTFLHNFVLAEVKMTEIVGKEAALFTAAIIVVALLLWRYARIMKRRGVLT